MLLHVLYWYLQVHCILPYLSVVVVSVLVSRCFAEYVLKMLYPIVDLATDGASIYLHSAGMCEGDCIDSLFH